MRTYLRRPSTWSTFLGLVAGVGFFVPSIVGNVVGPYELRSAIYGFMSLFISFVLTTFFQQIELEKELSTDVRRVQDDIGRVAPLSKLTVSAPQSAAKLSQAAGELHDALTRQHHEEIQRHADRLAERLYREARALSDGRFQTSFWDCDILKREVERMTTSLIGYSPLISEKERAWWTSPSGREFLETNKRVKGMGCKITRIFCVPDDITDVEHILREHADLDLEVRIITPDCAKIHMPAFTESSAVVDGRIAYYSKKNEKESVNIWFTDAHDVREQERVLLKLRDDAKPYVKADAR